jgi:hypothetical protein
VFFKHSEAIRVVFDLPPACPSGAFKAEINATDSSEEATEGWHNQAASKDL